jgi:hypothetical protein
VNQLTKLARQASAGDSGALATLRQELHGRLGPIVRRALRSDAHSPLARRLAAAARTSAAPLSPDAQLVQAVQRVCDSISNGLKQARAVECPALETIRA